MLAQSVYPSGRYDGERANFVSVKRAPVNVPQRPAKSARLEHFELADPVPGIGRRRIPATGQHPGRRSNEAVVYTRLAPAAGEDAPALVQGDVVFVSKRGSGTLFGTGTARLTRVAGLEHINRLLERSENRIYPNDEGSTRAVLDARKKFLRAREAAFAHDQAELDQQAQNRQSPDSYFKDVFFEEAREARDEAILRHNVAGSKLRNGSSMRAGGAQGIYPQMDWLACPALADWWLDGVVHSTDVSREVVSEMFPANADSEVLLNVVVQGNAALRNDKRAKKPQFFDEDACPGDEVFVCVVWNRATDGSVGFRLKLTSGRQLFQLSQHVGVPSVSVDGFASDFGIAPCSGTMRGAASGT